MLLRLVAGPFSACPHRAPSRVSASFTLSDTPQKGSCNARARSGEEAKCTLVSSRGPVGHQPRSQTPRIMRLWSSRKCTGAAAFVRAFSSGSDPTVFTSLFLFGQKLPSALPKLQCERGSLPAPTEPVSEHVQGTQVAKAPKWPRRCSSFSCSSCSPASSGSADSSLLTSGCWYTRFEIHSFHSAFLPSARQLRMRRLHCNHTAGSTQFTYSYVAVHP